VGLLLAGFPAPAENCARLGLIIEVITSMGFDRSKIGQHPRGRAPKRLADEHIDTQLPPPAQ